MDTEYLLPVARRVLGVSSLAATDDLFDAGMTSLNALRLADEISSVLGREVTVADVYLAGSVEQIEALSAATAPQESSMASAPPGLKPLSHAQQRFWIAEQFAPAAADNMLVLAYAIVGPLDPEALRRAVADVVRQQPALRTRYPLTHSGVAQEVLPFDERVVVIEAVDAPGDEPDIAALAERVTADWWATAFVLEREAPLRVRLCRVDSGTHLLCLHLHHIAFDGRSEHLFLDDLILRYRQRSASVPEPLAGPDNAAIDLVDVEYWRQALAGLAPPFLPSPPDPTGEASRLEIHRRVPASTVDRIHTVTRSRRTPAVAALIAATARAAAAVYEVPDLVLGTVLDGRPQASSAAAVGYFVNPVAVPLSDVAGRDMAGLLGHAGSEVLAAFRHGRTPFDELVRRLEPDRFRHPWFQAWVVLQYRTPGGELAPGTRLRSVRVRPPRMTAELFVEAFPQDDGSWELCVAWRADSGGDSAIADLADRLVAALSEIAG